MLSTEFYVITALCAVANTILAKRNDRDQVVAFILGLLFGFIAIVGYLIAGKPTVKYVVDESNASSDRVEPTVGNVVDESSASSGRVEPTLGKEIEK